MTVINSASFETTESVLYLKSITSISIQDGAGSVRLHHIRFIGPSMLHTTTLCYDFSSEMINAYYKLILLRYLHLDIK